MKQAAEQPRACVGCGQSEMRGALQRDDDGNLRCRQCAAQHRIDACPVKLTDLTAITRRADRCLTIVHIQIDWQMRIEWLKFGEAQIRLDDKARTAELMAYLNGGATDFEHDSAYALSLPLIGLSWSSLHYHRATFTAWIPPDECSNFRVPRPGYDPFSLRGTTACKRCDTHHPIVPEGHYTPPLDRELYKLVAGKAVEINIGPVIDPEEKS